MTNESLAEVEDAITERSQPNVSILILGLAAIVAFFGAVGLVLYLKPGGDSPAPAVFVAGPLEAFPRGSVTYFKSEHLHIVRLADGAFLAIYDLGPRMQALLLQTGDKSWLECRAEYVEDSTAATSLGAAPPPGFEDAVFREPCAGSTWDVAGNRLFGPTPGNLDRFPVSVVDDSVHVDVVNRRCMNPVSPEAPCSPTQ